MTTQIQKPADLPNDRYVSLAERRAHQNAIDDYNASIREAEQRERQKQAAKTEPQQTGPRYLSDDEYCALRRKEWEEQQARDKAREEAEKAKQKAREDYLASDDDVVQILETSPYEFMLTFQHFVTRGFRLSGKGLEQFHPGFTGIGCFQCTMVKATPTTARKTK